MIITELNLPENQISSNMNHLMLDRHTMCPILQSGNIRSGYDHHRVEHLPENPEDDKYA